MILRATILSLIFPYRRLVKDLKNKKGLPTNFVRGGPFTQIERVLYSKKGGVAQVVHEVSGHL